MSVRESPGVTVGLVKDLNDPDSSGRIFVVFPELPGSPPGAWAHIATPMAGPGRGTFFMPEPGDEALVAFHHGDFAHPFIVGFLWNGQDKPPEGDRNVRRIRTTSGHTIAFDDRKGQQKVEIETAGGQKIILDDGAPGRITIQSNGEVAIKGARVKVDCTMATVSATGSLTLDTPMAMFSGIVQARAVITQAVQSAAYTVGVGNTFGL